MDLTSDKPGVTIILTVSSVAIVHVLPLTAIFAVLLSMLMPIMNFSREKSKKKKARLKNFTGSTKRVI